MVELEALAAAGEDVALVLAAQSLGDEPGASCWAGCATSTRTPSAGC